MRPSATRYQRMPRVLRGSCPSGVTGFPRSLNVTVSKPPTKLPSLRKNPYLAWPETSVANSGSVADGQARYFTVDALRSRLEDVVEDLHFDGDPSTDSTRRQLERIMKDDAPRRWPWLAAVAAGSTALMFWQIRRRRKNGATTNEPAPRRT